MYIKLYPHALLDCLLIFFIQLKHEVSPKDLCLFCVTCIRPLIHQGIVKNKLRELLPTRYESQYNLCNSHIKSHLFAPTEQRICSSCPCMDERTLPTTWAAVMFLHKAKRMIVHNTPVAQLVEHRAIKPEVMISTLAGPTLTVLK